MERQDCANGDLEVSRRRTTDGAQAEYRWRCASRSRWSRRRAARRFVYQTDSYRYWEHFLGRNGFSLGQFGENFTVEGLGDNEVASVIDTELVMRYSK